MLVSFCPQGQALPRLAPVLTLPVMPPVAFSFDNTFARELEGLYAPWQPEKFPSPELVVLNRALLADLGLDAKDIENEAAEIFSGNRVPDGSSPLAQVYAGHQFGHFSPQLGDGRALLLGEVVNKRGERRDIQLKGSGRTPFSRGGDGRATLGPILREYLMGEAMHRLGIPTTRALAAVTTGEEVYRTTSLPGAVLGRVASSHLRVGTFEFFAAKGEKDKLRRLTGYAIGRHYPEQFDAENTAYELLRQVANAQATLIAQWMLVGFIHGVMNTDNATISGETIDYGPCAFMDQYDLATVFSSIDHRGRYAYGNQPAIGAWNVARLAEALLPLMDSDARRAEKLAQSALEHYTDVYQTRYLAGMCRKLGLHASGEADKTLVDRYLSLIMTAKLDFTASFRTLAGLLRGEVSQATTELAAIEDFAPWREAWLGRIQAEGRGATETARSMDTVNPIYIPRNHKVEEALDAAIAGDLSPFEALLEVLSEPFEEKSGWAAYAEPAPDGNPGYQTFCGT